MREVETVIPAQLPPHVLRKNARGLAEAIAEATERQPQVRFTTYRRAMSMLTDYADRESRAMKPEMRKKLADAKRELRDIYGQPQSSLGEGGPGKKRQKAKAKSRRTTR